VPGLQHLLHHGPPWHLRERERASRYMRYNLRNANLGVPKKPRGMAIVVAGPKKKPQSVRDFIGHIDLAKLKAVLLCPAAGA
jgi:hypothetical protein